MPQHSGTAVVFGNPMLVASGQHEHGDLVLINTTAFTSADEMVFLHIEQHWSEALQVARV